MLKPLGITFIVSLFASLIIAMTLTPVLSSYLLTTKKQLSTSEQGGNVLVQKLNRFYARSLDVILRYKTALLVGAAGLLIVSIIIFSG